MQILSLGWEDPLEEGMAIQFSILPMGEQHGHGNLVGYTVYRVTKSETAETTQHAHK